MCIRDSTHIARPCEKAIAGFEEVKPMVFAGVYPIEAEDYELSLIHI